jgi:hypothetical protein
MKFYTVISFACVAHGIDYYAEPTDDEWFSYSHDGASGTIAPNEVRRFDSSTSPEVISEYLTRGIPVVVKGAYDESPMKQWTCEYITDNFKRTKMRREYDMSNDDEQNQIMFMDGQWMEQQVKIRYNMKSPPKGAPVYAPFYWDLAKAYHEGDREWGHDPMAAVRKIHDASTSKVPFFLEKYLEANRDEMRRSEFWLSPKDSGSLAHMDEHCHPTFATSLSGLKRWRLQNVPAAPSRDGYGDGNIYYNGQWNPKFIFNITAGEGIIFPPGMLHEGVNVGDECVSSFTFQYLAPNPTKYWRAFWKRLRMVPDLRSCFQNVYLWATIGGKVPMKAFTEERAREVGQKLFKHLDRDSDGSVTQQEIYAAVSLHIEAGELPIYFAEDCFSYHDYNGDNKITEDEIADNLVHYFLIERLARGTPGPTGQHHDGRSGQEEL